MQIPFSSSPISVVLRIYTRGEYGKREEKRGKRHWLHIGMRIYSKCKYVYFEVLFCYVVQFGNAYAQIGPMLVFWNIFLSILAGALRQRVSMKLSS